ncbi:fumarylacetoacetate hydrolase family protein [Pseudonocardia sp.]|jgi:2-keto-4-pentenoate hydratase/2-oxohepta-3-ene-1,7-dioic acid hydratase in catechol pathway|uniref:fumarylacetoacetate hydrolase family protein n=1 Tax=Pseudonocardia sp. TaxID=60912 RepID=UPI003D0DDC2C
MDVLATRWGVARRDGTEVALLDLPHRDLGELVRATGSLHDAHLAPVTRRLPLDEAVAGLVAPLGAIGTVWGVGMNYHSKARLTGRPIPVEPTLYTCAASAVATSGDALLFPDGCTEQLDGEAEIAVVVGRRMYRVDARDAWSHVAGITAANDLTARDVMVRTGNPTLAKSFPGCTPIGASVLPAEAVADPDAIGVRGLVDGVLRQDSTSADMIWPITELLSRISWFAALEPGDVLLTGTPAGTGQDRGTFLTPGSTLTVEVDGVLPLHTSIALSPVPDTLTPA